MSAQRIYLVRSNIADVDADSGALLEASGRETEQGELSI